MIGGYNFIRRNEDLNNSKKKKLSEVREAYQKVHKYASLKFKFH